MGPQTCGKLQSGLLAFCSSKIVYPPLVVYLGHPKDVLVAGLGGSGSGKPGTEPLPPVGQPLHGQLGQLVGQGRRPVGRYE